MGCQNLTAFWPVRARVAFLCVLGATNAVLPRAARERSEPIGGEHIAHAVWAELNKDNRQIRRSELGPLAGYLEEKA